jgi:Flp pilus assembly pilin Flp
MEKGTARVVYAVIVVLIVVAVVMMVTPWGSAVVGRFSSVRSGLPRDGEAPRQESGSPASEEIDFSKEGNMVGYQVEQCQLLYSEMGAPALAADLIFQDDSVCDLGQGEQLCSETTEGLLCGQWVKVEGIVEEEKMMGEGLPGDHPSKGKKYVSKARVVRLTKLANLSELDEEENCCVPSEQYSR